MNKLPVYVVLTAIVFFALGYYIGGSGSGPVASRPVPPVPVVDQTVPREPPPVDEPITELPREELAGGAEPIDSASETVLFGGVSQEMLRETMTDSLRATLADFFSIYQIPEDQADTIIQGLADNQVEEMLSTERPGMQELFSKPDMSEEERYQAELLLAEMRTRSEARQQAALGIYYEDYKAYIGSMPQRRLLENFSESLEMPLNSATRDELLRIFVEESAPFTEWPGGTYFSQPSQQEVLARVQEQVDATREQNARIMGRAFSYLTPEQAEQLSGALDMEIKRTEAMMRVMELSDMD